METVARPQPVEEIIHMYLTVGDALRLASLPNWISADLTASQVKAVVLLGRHDALAVGELAGLLGLGNPATSILVQQLVSGELAERSEDPQDRRRTLVRLTARGRELLSGQQEQRAARLRDWLSQMADGDLAALRQGLQALAATMSTERGERSGSASPACK